MILSCIKVHYKIMYAIATFFCEPYNSFKKGSFWNFSCYCNDFKSPNFCVVWLNYTQHTCCAFLLFPSSSSHISLSHKLTVFIPLENILFRVLISQYCTVVRIIWRPRCSSVVFARLFGSRFSQRPTDGRTAGDWQRSAAACCWTRAPSPPRKPIQGYRNHSDNTYSSPPRLSGFNALFMRALGSCEINKYRSLRLVKRVLYCRNHSVQEMSTKPIIDEVSETVRLVLINYVLNMYE